MEVAFGFANGLRRNRGSMGTDGDAEYIWGRQGCRVISVHKVTNKEENNLASKKQSK